jgi:hypothetical protein
MQCRIRLPGEVGGTVPDAVQMVYDDYNFLVIGFGPTRRASTRSCRWLLTPAV